ncbi:MAG: EAL domain-containing protein [Gammaproteobacteria bacterium]|nr:EAL domain-containing protein [Gammaproteobacteria bacterium]MDH4254781.1 EAL domain-containing protein [Gammaproteobacteria bacterium]MDH5309892.1 EAL domain-containing protein [Gammaproteobacteria bacterium]
MRKELEDKIRAVSKQSGGGEPDFLALLKHIDEHYDKLEATITQSLTRTLAAATPIQVIFDSVTDALMSVSPDGVVRHCNRICTRYFGIDAKQLVGMPFSRLVPAAAGIEFADFLRPYMSEPDDTHIDYKGGEIVANRTGGESFIAEVKASRLSSGETDVFVISLRDVTGRKAAETALRENEERYRALVENAPEAIVVFDVDENRFSDANDNACQLFNLSRKRLLSIGPKAISPPTQPDGTPSFGIKRGYIDRALNGEHPTFEWLHRNANGRDFPCEVRFSRLPAGDRRLIRVSMTDISERKKAEELGFAQNKILEMIAENAPFDRTLRAICRCVEKIDPGMRAAIMLYDERKHMLSVEQAPSLPEPFKLMLDFVPAGPDSIACGSAAHDAREKVVPDIASDPAWQGYVQEARKHGIAAAWSFPVVADGGKVLGTLDLYLDQPRRPMTDQLDKIGRIARLAGIAVRRRLDEERLRTSETRYRGLFENVVDGVYIASRDGDIITVNPALVEMLGYTSEDELKKAGRTTRLYVNPIDRERVFARLEAQGVVRNFEYRLRRKDGREIVVLENSRAIYDESGNIVAHEGTITDITDRKIAETRIFEEKERAQVTLQSIGDGVITTDAEGRIDYINPVAQDLTGWDMRSARGKAIDEIMRIVNEHTRSTVENPVMRCLKEGRVITLAPNSLLIVKDGQEVPIQDSAAPIRDRIGNIIGSVMVFHDVSKESRLFRQLSYQASHDAVTGLINRREFENQLVAALQGVHENPSRAHGLLYVDLDQFKVVNDTFGHVAGDELLRQITEIIQTNVRSSDIVSRLGGDEFGVLLERCDQQRAMQVAEAIRLSVEQYRFQWQEAFTNVRCSIGVVMITADSADVASIMSSADVACYSAKDMGRNQIHLYQDSDASLRHEEMKWVSRITSAVEDNRLELYFQPIVGIGSHKTESRGHYELLLRMRDENGELVQPDQFIPAAERYNMMSTLDRWVVREALTRLADRETRSGPARYTVAVNLSGTSLSEDRFLEFVISELQKHRLAEGAICFEITETAAISNLSRVIHFMQALKKLGCKFSLDDFGSGLSSFTYLKNLPVDYLKIDGQFIRNVVEDTVDESMVRAINEVGHAMGIETIAERVETRQVLDKLGTLGVSFAQGYFIARPESVRAFEPWAGRTSSTLRA